MGLGRLSHVSPMYVPRDVVFPRALSSVSAPKTYWSLQSLELVGVLAAIAPRLMKASKLTRELAASVLGPGLQVVSSPLFHKSPWARYSFEDIAGMVPQHDMSAFDAEVFCRSAPLLSFKTAPAVTSIAYHAAMILSGNLSLSKVRISIGVSINSLSPFFLPRFTYLTP